jgi:serine beta-lactamase-like protein LACTB, mitochondrial
MKKLIYTILFIWIAIPCRSQSSDTAAIELTRGIAFELLKVSNMPAISVAISRNGRIVFAEAFGYADVENKIPVTSKTQFRTASVAKIITATALAKLIQDGKLDLDSSVQKYVPEFPKKSFPITPRQLAGHLSGLPHYSDADKIDDRVYSSVKDALGVFSHVDLIAEPGTRYKYSTHGYTLLSAVIEGASGMSYLDYMKSKIFKPLKMDNTGPDERRQKPNEKAAKLYTVRNDVKEEIKIVEEVSYKWAGGGLLSTPTDLIHMAHGYFNGFLRSETVRSMFESQSLKSGDKTQVGIGWRISQDIDGRKVIEHAGSMQGARSVICIYPDEELVISIMVNAEWPSTIEETAHMMARPFLVRPASQLFPGGRYIVSTTTVNVRGEETTGKGTLELAGRSGKITFDTGEEVSIKYLSVGNVYALIRPDGVYHMTIDFDRQVVKGRAIGYGSQLSQCPIANPPFFSFISTDEN